MHMVWRSIARYYMYMYSYRIVEEEESETDKLLYLLK